MAPNNAYKMLENCNLGVKVAKSQRLNFSLVGIDGANFHRGDRKLILALIWQACKYHILTILKTIGGGKEVSEAGIFIILARAINNIPNYKFGKTQ